MLIAGADWLAMSGVVICIIVLFLLSIRSQCLFSINI